MPKLAAVSISMPYSFTIVMYFPLLRYAVDCSTGVTASTPSIPLNAATAFLLRMAIFPFEPFFCVTSILVRLPIASIDSLYACSYPMPTETSISMHITPIAMDNAVRLVRTRRRDRFIMPVRIKSLGRIATPLFYYQRHRYCDYCRRARRSYPYWEC